MSLAHYPQSNGRVEVAAKVAKNVLRGNTVADGGLDNDKASLAILQYLTISLRDMDKSPAQLSTGRHADARWPSRTGYRPTDSGGRRHIGKRVKWGSSLARAC